MAVGSGDRLVARWLRGMITASILSALALWRLTEATVRGDRAAVLLWGFVMVLVVTVQTFVMKRSRVRGRVSGWKWRAWWQGQQLLVGAVLLVGWGAGGARAGLGFAGLLSAFLGLSWAVSEIRESEKRSHEQFVYWLAVAVVLLAFGFFVPGVPQRLAVAMVIAGGIAAYIAIVTGAQAHFRSIRTGDPVPAGTLRSSRLRLGVGAAAFAIPTFVLFDVSRWWGLALAVAVLVVVTLGVSRSEWNPVLFVAVFVLIPAFAPTPTPVEDFPGPTPGPGEMFVVFGDSYISGEGARNFYEGTNRIDDNQCRRAPSAWPVQLALDETDAIPGEMLSFACSGARARELWWIDQGAVGDDWGEWSDQGQGQLAQYRAATARLGDKPVAFALVSIGGNDAGFGDIAKSCLAPADCTEVARQWVEGLRGRRHFEVVPPGYHQGDGSAPPAGVPGATRTTLQDELELVYDRIREAVGADVPLIAVPYPHPVRATGCDATLLSAVEHRFIEAFVDDLNAVVHAAAVESGVHYIDTIPNALDGSRLCESDGPVGVNFIQFSPINGAFEDIVLPSSAIHGSLHPNGTGHTKMAAAAREWFAHTDLSQAPVYEPSIRSTPDAASLVAAAPPDACPGWADDDDDESTPNFRCDANGWAVRQILRTAGTSSGLLVLLVGGAWLIAREIVGRLQRWKVPNTADDVFPFAPSPPEHHVLRILDRRPLRWLHGGIDPRRN